MAALWNGAGHYIFALYFVLLFSFFPRLISAVADRMSAILKRAARGSLKSRTQKLAKNHHLGTITQLCRATSSQLRHVSTIGKVCQAAISTPHIPTIAAEIGSLVWSTPANFNGFRVLASLLQRRR